MGRPDLKIKILVQPLRVFRRGDDFRRSEVPNSFSIGFLHPQGHAGKELAEEVFGELLPGLFQQREGIVGLMGGNKGRSQLVVGRFEVAIQNDRLAVVINSLLDLSLIKRNSPEVVVGLSVERILLDQGLQLL
ncbi:hypothetical protein SDC9_167803 [bioreactor metagenome]|uniref:Uncharacterized protein n=1 Tax=bioreactor metagenome TaxID=1076179 RepID=A0A645G8J9_9ZZZZ